MRCNGSPGDRLIPPANVVQGFMMIDWITSLMSTLGYGGIALLMFLGNVFPPIPSELVMPLAGFTTAQGDLSMVGVIVAGTIGSLLGALPWYYAGRIYGIE